jgi:tetratricopeptide (TPR) repeat protein
VAENDIRLKSLLEKANQEIKELKKQTFSNTKPEPKTAPLADAKPAPPLEQPLVNKGDSSITLSAFTPIIRNTAANKAYTDGITLFDRNELVLAVNLFHHARELGHPGAEKMLGECYYFIHQLDEAFYWYQQAAAKGDVEATYSMGYMYYYGEGTKKNFKKAVESLTLAAAKGDVYAKNMLLEISDR